MTSRPGLRDSGDSQLPSIPIVITPRRESPHRMRQPKQQPKKPAEGAEFFQQHNAEHSPDEHQHANCWTSPAKLARHSRTSIFKSRNDAASHSVVAAFTQAHWLDCFFLCSHSYFRMGLFSALFTPESPCGIAISTVHTDVPWWD